MKDLYQILSRVVPPVPWDEGDNIPWNEPGFSERMLKEHLSQDHDLASRKTEKISGHARWIVEELLGSKPGKVLDLACGPGLYTCALAELGCECVGVDFSPASIQYANENAAARQLPCTHRIADVRDDGFGNDFDLAMIIYGQINVFERPQAKGILAGMFHALKPGGTILIEPQTHDHVRGEGHQTSSWYTAQSGLFSSEPHLVLQEGYWDEPSNTRTERFFVIDVATSRSDRYALSTVAYKNDEFERMMSEAGFEGMRSFASLLGEVDEGTSGTLAVVGGKPV